MSPFIIGHRGARGLAPENTLLSIETALAHGVAGIEIDVHRCASGELVVIHDDTLERTTNGIGFVRDHRYEELQHFRACGQEWADQHPEVSIPTLQEVLDLLKGRAMLMVEIKADDAAEPAAIALSDAIEQQGWRPEDLWFVSFHHPLLAIAKTIDARLQTGATFVGIPSDYAALAERAGAQAICPAIDHADEALIADARARQLSVFTWTVNDPRKLAKAHALKVDGIITDYPDRCKALG